MNDLIPGAGGEMHSITMPEYNLGMCTNQAEADQWKNAAQTFRNYAKWTKTKFESLTSISRSWRDMSVYSSAFQKSHGRDNVAVQKSQMSLDASKRKYSIALNEARLKYSAKATRLPF